MVLKWFCEKTAKTFRCHRNTVCNIRHTAFREGNRGSFGTQTTGESISQTDIGFRKENAQLIAIGCSQPPEGRSGWTLKLLAEKLVALDVVESISHQTVWRRLKKTS